MKAVVFPGQGSQHSGMLSALYQHHQETRDYFRRASQICDVDFGSLFFDADNETQLHLTENTQPALVLASYCTWRAYRKYKNLQADYLAGHSLGEYSALLAADSLSFDDAIRAVKERGRAMQEAVAVGQGAMLAVMGIGADTLNEICHWVSSETQEVLQVANYNSPSQIVISGSAAAAHWLQENFIAEKFGVTGRYKWIPLKVSAPFHCPLMRPAQERMARVLAQIDFRDAKIPVVQNFTAQIEQQADRLRENLLQQVTGTVRWWESCELLLQHGVKQFTECGPGSVLSNLLKKIDTPALQTFNIPQDDDVSHFEEAER